MQNAYDRNLWISTLQFLTGKREFLTINLSPKTIQVNTQQAERLIKAFNQIGSVKTSDGITLPIFEVILENNIRIEHNRVAVNEFIKKHIIRDAIKGALVTFSYDEGHHKTEWRFSFISKNAANDFFAEAEAEETNPKKYTYIFGNKEEHRTAIERLYNLEQSRFRLEDFFEAFNVEPVSKKFFEEYKHLYKELSDYIINEKQYFDLFKRDTDVSPEKEVRNFVSRLLGRIVFLYFLQKKNWLGATSIEYKDGSTSFLSDLFFSDEKNQDDFYSKYLCPIFFEALNTADRKNDEFKLENGKILCIPFLNGGLFEEEQEPNGHRDIKIPAFQFKMLFDFFNGFNFTVYENSPEEHTVAVDPEMLGHIFENLIDYNKDTGTFYTPKEIVQYMTQESLIEYLNTHLQKDRAYIENLVKNQSTNHFKDEELKKINQLLDDVKICDPAIGSGAFPMGMLQEIFNLKALINFKLGFEVWSPATVKQNIIQNSIYGVDLDEGAVEIARLRFWLSLVVDEGMPKALPNLDYKIMQGNSLLESYRGIDLSGISTGNDLKIIEEMQIDLFGNFVDDQMKMTIGKSGLAEEIQKLIKKYFTAKAQDKRSIKNKIEAKIAEHISFNMELRENQLLRQIAELENVNTLKPIQKKALEKLQNDLEILTQTKYDLKKEQQKDEKNYFLWHLFFGDVLNAGGFDIVIGNPPYVQMQKLGKQSLFLEAEDFVTFKRTGDIYVLFYEKAFNILKNKGILSYITSNTWMRTKFGEELRKFFLNETHIVNLINIEDTQIFPSATVEVNILISQKKSWEYPVKATVIKGNFSKGDSISEYVAQNYSLIQHLSTEGWIILDNLNYKLKKEIENNGVKLRDWNVEFYRGFLTGFNDAFFIDEKTKTEILSQEPHAEKIIKPLLRGRDIKKYDYDYKNSYVIFPHNGYTTSKKNRINRINIDEYPVVKTHLNKYINELRIRADQGNTIYNLRNCAYVEVFDQEKIVWLSISDKPAFALDMQQMYVTAPAYIMTSDRSKYLLAFLNSKIMEWYLDKVSSSTGQGTNQWSKIFVEQLPIPIINDGRKEIIETLVNIITYCTKNKNIFNSTEINSSQISSFFEEIIDGLIFDLYFEEEMKYKEIYITDEVKASLQEHNIGNNFENLDEVIKKEIILSLYKEWSQGNVQVKMTDYTTKSPTILKPILQS
ncbi:Eco57I restriction-modification methylase domain-containing protein [Elizabethkingia anophelis]|uniref:Eco57I restriction-modification methylase domain-containing protein n=1 Tax=Elizabethkingia anophelis TaxID=1117645 RepID=UPI003891E766|nr:Eco57I restriction-modification methylase domain-containing protein [Elizabethkingia anophelis]